MIREFQGDWRFLSNFWPCKVKFEGMTFPSAEHAYQAAKTVDVAIRCAIAKLGTPGQAKRFWRGATLPHWDDSRKLAVMRRVVEAKFRDNPSLAKALVATGDTPLQEGNRWGDMFWGVDLRNGIGRNELGKILMDVRKELA